MPARARRPLARAAARGILDLSARGGLEGLGQSAVFVEGVTPMAVMDRALRYRAWNPAMATLLALPDEAVLGWHAPDCFPILLRNGGLRGITRTLDGFPTVNVTWFAVPKTDTWLITRSRRRPVYGWGGRVEGVLLWLDWVRRVQPFPWPFTFEDEGPR